MDYETIKYLFDNLSDEQILYLIKNSSFDLSPLIIILQNKISQSEKQTLIQTQPEIHIMKTQSKTQTILQQSTLHHRKPYKTKEI